MNNQDMMNNSASNAMTTTTTNNPGAMYASSGTLEKNPDLIPIQARGETFILRAKRPLLSRRIGSK
jgi:hypothetical protein